MKNVLAVAGSLRRGSYNRLLLEAAPECAPPDMTVRLYRDLGSIPLFDEDKEQAFGGGAAVLALRDQVAAADGVLIATPEYNWSIPGVLKNVIDWLSRPALNEVLVAKPIALVGASGGRWGTRLAQNALRQILTATESFVLPSPCLFVHEAERLFDAQGRLIDPTTRDQLTSVLVALGGWIGRVGRQQRTQVESDVEP